MFTTDLEQRRLQLQELLEELLGSENVYFQPPSQLIMQYPCIIYDWARADSKFADNALYRFTSRYTVTLITRDPSDSRIMKLASLPMATHERWFAGDGLNHHVFNLYF